MFETDGRSREFKRNVSDMVHIGAGTTCRGLPGEVARAQTLESLGRRTPNRKIHNPLVAAPVLYTPYSRPPRHNADDMYMTCSSMEHETMEVIAESSIKTWSDMIG
jgi:hypothetical protein